MALTHSCLRKCDKIQQMDLEHARDPDDVYQAKSLYNIPIEDFQTRKCALSTTDITRHTLIHRNTENINYLDNKSQEKDLYKLQKEDDEFEYVNGLCFTQKSNSWGEGLVKLAEKLRKPGGEEKLKHKIRQYLKQFPGNFDDDDEEGQRFRQQLPDYIVDKLKSTLTKQDKDSKPPSTMIYLPSKQRNLKTVIKAWIKILPIMKKDFLGRVIKRDDILESLLQRLEPFILYRPKSNRDFKNILLSYITEIASSIPLERDMNKEKEYLTSVVSELVENILTLEGLKRRKAKIKKTGSMQNVCDINYGTNVSQELKIFVIDELGYLLKDSNRQINKKVMQFIVTEIVCIFSDALQYPGMHNNSDLKSDICNVLQEDGDLPNFQAKYFCNELIEKFKYVFLKNAHKSKKRYGAAYSETCLVYNVSQIHNTHLKKPYCDNIDDTNAEAYTKIISLHIDRWLCSIQMYLPLVQHQVFRDTAVNELTNAIINRHKYLIHTSNQGTAYDEHGHIKYLIFKWIRKLAGEDNVDIIKNVPELLDNIEKVIIPGLLYSKRNLQNSQSYTISTTSKANYEYDDSDELLNYLYEEIYDWYSELPLSLQNLNNTQEIRTMIRKLADNVTKCLKTNACLNDRIDREVDLWAKNVLKRLPRSSIVEELKTKIKIRIFRNTQIKNDASMQVRTDMKDIGTKTDCIIRFTKCTETPVNLMKDIVNVIDQWLDSLPLSVHHKDIHLEAIHNLAADIMDRHIYLELYPILRGTEKDELENLKYHIYKRLNEVISENNMELVTRASDLLQRLQRVFFKTKYRNVHSTRLSNPNDAEMSKTLSLRDENNNEFSNKPSHSLSGLDYSLEQNLINISGTAEGQGCYKSQRFEQLVYPSIDSPHRMCSYVNKYTDDGGGFYYVPKNSYFRQTLIEENNQCHKTCPCNCNEPTPKSSPIHLKPTYRNSKICLDIGITTDTCKSDVYTLSHRESKRKLDAPESYKWHSSTIEELPVGMSLSKTYECFDEIFRKRCEEIPIDDSSIEQIAIGENTKREINNIIWKTYFRLKADPSIENDYKLFLAVLDDQLDVLMNHLPQTKQMIRFRLKWKSRVVNDILRLLDYVHNITTPPTYKEKLIEKFNHHFSKSYDTDSNQHLYIVKIIDAYILFLRYKTGNHTRTNIYRQRLMQTIIEFIESLKFKNSNRIKLNSNEFYEETLGILNGVPLPDDKHLKNEANEILIDDEIEQWYDDLYGLNSRSEFDGILLQKTREILTRKLFEIEEKYRSDPEKLSQEMVCETIEFLKRQRFANVENLPLKAANLVSKLKKIFNKNSNSTTNIELESENSYVDATLSGLLLNANMRSRVLHNNEYPSGTKSTTNARLKIPPHQIFLVAPQDVNRSISPHNVINRRTDERPTSAPPLANYPTNIIPNNVGQAFRANPREFDVIGFPPYPVTRNVYAEYNRYNRGCVNKKIASLCFANRPEYMVRGSINQYGNTSDYRCFQTQNLYPYGYTSCPYPYMMPPLLAPPY